VPLQFPAHHRCPVPAPSFGRLQAVELNVPIGCADVAIYPGDIIVGDAEASSSCRRGWRASSR